MKLHEDDSMIAAFKQVYLKLEGLGHKSKLHILNNECSKCIQHFLEKKGTKHHHVASHNHCVNAAKPAVKTAKYNLIAALAMLNWNCEIQLWSKMARQMQETLNIFRTPRIDTTKQLTRKQRAGLIGLSHH